MEKEWKIWNNIQLLLTVYSIQFLNQTIHQSSHQWNQSDNLNIVPEQNIVIYHKKQEM